MEIRCKLGENRTKLNEYKLLELVYCENLLEKEQPYQNIFKDTVSYSKETLRELQNVLQEGSSISKEKLSKLKNETHYLKVNGELKQEQDLCVDKLKETVHLLETINDMKLIRLPKTVESNIKYIKKLLKLQEIRVDSAGTQLINTIRGIPNFDLCLSQIMQILEKLETEYKIKLQGIHE